MLSIQNGVVNTLTREVDYFIIKYLKTNFPFYPHVDTRRKFFIYIIEQAPKILNVFLIFIQYKITIMFYSTK